MQDRENKEVTKGELIIVTGLSGAGKSVAIQSLEDLGYFCVDNLPPILLPKFIELMAEKTPSLQKVAIGIDLRGREFFQSFVEEINKIKNDAQVHVNILYADAETKKLISRYKETRRQHPLQKKTGLTLVEAIDEERQLLAEVRSIANFIVDTTKLTPKQLKKRIAEYFNKAVGPSFTINVTSFGFKHGIQIDADIVFDVRFLPNPYYIEALRPLTGMDAPVYDYVMKWQETETFYSKLLDLLLFTIPGYQKEGKSQLVIAIGCTGGQHRSVALAQRLADELQRIFDYNIYVYHRDAHIESGEKK
ncbi:MULTISPECIES: RNase adapter RapZ [unclassified Staphylococcus]|uniref:RNase adapter RapZ n=1 Tax=unclassified Staphylococcus TaxID=91994 RepID=UPI0021CE8208|nr:MULTISPECIES: RNase adapter RapZ [unclassified Staphylococcus]UXR70009.1 RNase adapter RapZ [Staphylococcus sp. IVB6246]UXR72049.1 RNase adapter RapZ [Staphylococcus sp. IVB6240]UXR74357.1 RNase adapter RapZ [Staphylococcus sp. IVB6238]UXR76744.1 RNase adapter RapZ [Staphylococcus sp. IVB6233]UXR80874.1 RNase adapter RapZ [Staphylococcus sp. IVB6218]